MVNTHRQKQFGFTLIELLISLSLLGVLSLALFQTVGGTISLSGSVNATNDLIREGQIAQQVLSARLQEACYLFPSGTTIQMSSSNATTANAFNGNTQTWIVNTHPILAVMLPGTATATQRTFQFFAYYAQPRGQYVTAVTGTADNPGGDALNDATTWVLLQYQASITVPITTTCAQASTSNNTAAGVTATATQISFSGSTGGRMLIDYVAPVTPSTTLFNVDAGFADFDLQLQRAVRSTGTTRVGGSTNSNLRGRISPQNLGL
jgi:prepilin-type N-terminal cleavage/methylation domain-containing protein